MKNITEFIVEAANAGDIQKRITNLLNMDKNFLLVTNKDASNNVNFKAAVKAAGYTLITVYCKELGVQTIEKADWAEAIANNSSKQYLVLFNDIDANPEVANAIMPIALEKKIANKKYDNFVVAASCKNANNISKPLLSRLGATIEL